MMNSPSSAADVWTRRQPKAETDTEDKEPVDNKTVDIPPVHTYDELKKIRRDAYVKMVAIIGVVVTALVFGSVAWFTQNREVEGAGVQMTASSDLFSIETLESPAHVGIYDNSNLTDSYVRNLLLSGIGKNNDIITWNITDDTTVTNQETNQKTLVKGKNIGNAPATGYEGGINPGSSGTLQFVIVPIESIDAKFTFHLYAFTGGYDEKGDEDKSTIEYIDSNSNAEAILADSLLNGHILLFSEIDNSGKYSGLITSDADFNRILEKTYATKTTISLYWVWPETLAELMLDDTSNEQKKYLRGKPSVCNSSGRQEVITYFKNHVSWFLLDPDNTNHDWQFTSSMNNTAIINEICTNYNLYSSYYNEADQCIGTYVTYLFLDMIADGKSANSN